MRSGSSALTAAAIAAGSTAAIVTPKSYSRIKRAISGRSVVHKRKPGHHVFEELVGQRELIVAGMARQSKKADVEMRSLAHQCRHRHRRRKRDAIRQPEGSDALAQCWI